MRGKPRKKKHTHTYVCLQTIDYVGVGCIIYVVRNCFEITTLFSMDHQRYELSTFSTIRFAITVRSEL